MTSVYRPRHGAIKCTVTELAAHPIPRGRARDNADRTQQRATAGAWVLEPDERGLRGYLANDGRKPRETSIRPCGIGGRRCGLASLPSYPADWLRCLMRVPIAPAPDVLRRLQRSLPASTGRQAGAKKRSANRLRTRCGRAYNRYGDKCQDHSPHNTTNPVAPCSTRGLAALRSRRARRKAQPRVKHGATARFRGKAHLGTL